MIMSHFNCDGLSPSTCWPVCDHTVTDYSINCVDDNTVSGDGCDDQCEVETGWVCNVDGCQPVCGDGVILPNEQCDDGELGNDDGCD